MHHQLSYSSLGSPFNSLIDPLKAHSYGQAGSPLHDLYSQGKKPPYNPIDKRSKSIDEWRALQTIQQLKLMHQERDKELHLKDRAEMLVA